MSHINNTHPDTDFIKAALDKASMNALRIALYHETSDESLATITVKTNASRGGALTSYSIEKADFPLIKEKALAYLTAQVVPKAPPTKDEAAKLMALFTGHTPTQSEINFGYEDLGFEQFPRNALWQTPPSAQTLDDYDVTIIGSGFSGIAAAIQLSRLGIPYRILERHPDIGGTWFVNDYPEARVDVSTFLYQYKFEAKYPWRSFYADRDELLEYINFIVDKYDIRQHITCNADLKSAKWDNETNLWHMSIAGENGEMQTLSSRFLISAAGLFRTPKIPKIKGIETFAGEMFHTTEWDHGCDLSDKNVAVIGTGSTGSQLVCHVAERAKQLSIYQRTANWVTPVKGYKDTVSPEKRWLLNTMPGYANWYGYASYIAELPAQELQILDPDYIAKGGHVNSKNTALQAALTEFIRYKVGDDEALFKKLIPTHPPLARRLVIDNEWYDTLLKDNVELVTDGIDAITPTGIQGTDGTYRAADVIVLSAGFEVSEFLWPVDYHGKDGATLEGLWAKDGARAYKGMTLPGFPNFFMFYGPNAQARAGSFHSWVEILARYIGEVMVATIEGEYKTVEVKSDMFERYNHDLRKALKNILWETQGKGGYYLNKQGHSHINMPWTLNEFYDMVRSADREHYDFGP